MNLHAVGVSKAACFLGGVEGLLSGMAGFVVSVRPDSNNYVFLATVKVWMFVSALVVVIVWVFMSLLVMANVSIYDSFGDGYCASVCFGDG
jgi:hypothetical protein